MNILYISYDGLLDFVSQSQVLPYLNGLSGRGNRITLLTYEKRDRLNDKQAIDDCSSLLKEHHVDWIRHVYHKRPVISATLYDIFRGIVAGIQAIRRKEISIVHSRGYVAALIGVVLKFLCKTKFIFDMRGFWPDEKVDAGSWMEGGALHRAVKILENYLLRRADEIVVLTDSAKKRLLEEYPGRTNITVIPCCVDLGSFREASIGFSLNIEDIKKRTVILYSGSLGSFYGLEKIFEFFVFFRKERKDAFLWIISNYPAQMIRHEASSRDIDVSDYRVDTFTHREMPEAFAHADFSIIFYNRRLSGEGCSPIKLGESLACGVPVVINSGIGDCDRIVEENRIGIVLKDFSKSEYERAAEELTRLAADRDATSRRCRSVAERFFSLEKGIEKYQKIYDKLKG